MRRLMLSLVVLGGAAAFGGNAGAAPLPVPAVAHDVAQFESGQVEAVQYGPGWRERQEWRRRQAWRHERWERRHGYGGPPGYYAGRGYPRRY